MTILNIPPSVLYKNFDLHYIPNTMLNKHPLAGNNLKNLTNIQQQPSQNQNHGGYDAIFEMENGSVGLLLAVKAFVQLFVNPIVGNQSGKFGHKSIIFFGTISLLIAALIFAMGESFLMLFIARAIEGVGSSCINVCGMSLIAHVRFRILASNNCFINLTILHNLDVS